MEFFRKEGQFHSFFAFIYFSFTINNAGNREIIPRGAVYVYNRRGQEVAKLDANQDGEKVGANGGSKDFLVSWNGGEGLGKFKAKLELEYGNKETRDLQDVMYFWFLPKRVLIIFVSSLILVIIFLTTMIFRRTYKIQHPGKIQEEIQNDGVLNLKDIHKSKK